MSIRETDFTAAIIDVPEDRYHSMKELSRSQLVDFIESPMLYWKRHIVRDPVWQQKPSDAMDFGTFCHEAILIHKDATRGFRVIPDHVLSASGSRAGAKWKDWEAANAGVAHFKSHEVGPWLAMWDSLKCNEHARRLLLDNYEQSYEEKTVLWSHEGVDMRCRVDRVIPGHIVDLKTCANGDLNAIEREIENRKLYVQAAFYQWGWSIAAGEELPFTFVFVEKSAPFRTVCVTLDSQWIDDGMSEIIWSLDRLQQCATNDDWTDPCNRGVFTLSRPKWTNYRINIGE